MKPAALLWWRLVLLWLSVLALVSRHPSCYVGCTEQLEEATSLPAQDIVSQEEQSENTATAEESWVSHVHSLSEDELMAAGQRPDEDLDTRALVEEDEDVEQVPESAMRAEEPAAEVKLETETDDAAAAAAAAAGEPEPDAQLPDTPPPPTITQDQQPAASSEPSPASPAPSGATAVTAGDATPDSADASSISASQQDQTLSSGSDHVESDLPPPEPSDEHLATTDCEAGEANPYDDASPPVVLENTSNAHIAGTKTHTDPAMSPPPARSTDSLGGNTSHMLKEKALSPPVAAETDSSTAQVPVLSSKDPEDIPTFDEWKRKVMEVENEKTQATHTSSNGASVPVKKVQKNFNNNYASVECGAKILGSNPEAKSTSAILMENMDMYMLNPCSNKIWFIIELCEPIQLKQLDIANFELFSSTPKDFLVSISDRYPTNKWLKLGTFHGRDERTVQSFPLDEHLYAKYVKMFTKYIKVELISHFGSEHFCPLSLIRVFGTSMVEEYEEIADPSERAEDQDDDLDYPPGYALGEIKSSKNLIGSAKDAILNMVNTAVNVLGGSSEMQGNASFQEVNMTEPPLQTEANTEAAGAATTIAPMPDAEEVEILVDSDFPATEAPPPDLPTPELPVTESTELELPPVEDSIVTPLPADEDESISSTITLLGEEEDEDEESKEEREAKEKRQHESSDCCGPLSFSSQPSSSTFCSCSSSLQEYLMQQCSTQLSKQIKPQIPESKATITPHPYLPALKLPFSPPASPVTQPPHTDINQPQDKELDPGSAESAVGPSEVPLIPGNVSEPQTGSVSEPPVLEPSQTSSLPKPSATESPAAKSTPAAQLPQHSSKGLPKEPRPDRSQDEQAAERQGGTTVSPSVSVPVDRPSGSATVEHVSVPPTDDKPKMDFGQSGQDPPSQATESAEPAHTSQPSTASEPQPVPPATPESYSPAPEELLPAPPTASEPDPSEGLSATATESKVVDDLTEDMIFTSTIGHLPRPSSTSPPSSSSSPTHSEFYAELNNMTEQGNGNQVHGSSLKESVFMRLNNRIKALEMNMSLSGRYLEQLSQRYRKQMEEMQKAFNKTIIKLQNTARMAEEQDLRQTESIQSLQGQLENITQLVLNLSVRVSQLQSDVSDRQSYLLASLTLCLFLGLVLCANRCGASADIEPPALLAEPEPPEESSSYSNCERQFASCDDTWLKRRASYPLLHSDSLQIPTTEGPESLPTVETQRFSPANRKKRRAKVKPREGVETLKAASLPTPDLANGFAVCNGLQHAANPAHRLLHAAFKDSPSEGSSEGGSSSHSDDPSFCGIATIATACTRLCDGLPPPRTKAEKRALRRRRPRPGPSVVDLLQAPRRDKIDYMPVPSTLQDLRSNELSSGTFGANTALSGPA